MPATTESRERRQQAILNLLQQRPVNRQAELVSLLREAGIEATQSSVSRDLRQLGITKLGQGYQPQTGNGSPAVADLDVPTGYVRDIETAGTNLTVIRTATGAAQRVAVFLDRSQWPEIVGTVSGDDTIFVATRGGQAQRQLLNRLRSVFPA